MSKVEQKKRIAIERITHHLLQEGLNKTGLRLLAEVSGTSDRMLIYYFGSKEALLNEVFGVISGSLTMQLDALLGTHLRSGEQLLEELTALGASDILKPSIQLWFELVGLAARGEEPYASNAKELADKWIAWFAFVHLLFIVVFYFFTKKYWNQ